MGWVIKAHPRFEGDIKKLSKKDKEQLHRLILRIKEDPYRFKPMKGFTDCFRVRFGNLRLVFAIKSEIIWLIIVDKRKKVYKEMRKRLE